MEASKGYIDCWSVKCGIYDIGCRARRGIKNDSIDIIELSKGFQPIAIVSISKKRKLCLSLSIDGQFTVIHYPSIPSYNYLIVKGFDRKKKCLCWELNSNAFHGFIVKFKGFWQAGMSS